MEALRKCNHCSAEAYTRDDLEGFVKSKNYRYGRRNICKSCDVKRVAQYKKELPEEVRKERERDAQYKSYYGINLHEYNTILKAQARCCAICRSHEDVFTKNLFVDHCHTTGKVRGLLCSNCNAGLGMLKDNIEVLETAIQYLKGERL